MKLLMNVLGTLAATSFACGSAAAAPAGPLDLSHPLPFGDGALDQSVRSTTIAAGVTRYTITRGAADAHAAWTLVGDVADSDAAAGRLTACFAAMKLPAQTAEFNIPGAPAQTYRIVSGGAYASRAAAVQAGARALAAGCALYPRHSSEDSTNKSGPWTVDIVAIAPQAGGRLFPAVADQRGSVRRLTSELAHSAHALVATNGGFFVEQDVDGFPGQPAGISILAGRPNSAPVATRPVVVFPNRAGATVAIVRNFDWSAALTWSDGSQTHLDGINRKVGIVRNCGRDAGEHAVHDYTCTYQNDLVFYPPGSRFVKQVQDGTRFAFGADGKLRQLMPGELPAAAEAMLAASAGDSRIGQIKERVERTLVATFKASSSLFAAYGNDLSATNAGPTLLAGGAEVREDAQEGWAIDAVDDAKHKLLMHDWINRRNPRTAIGVRDDGVVLLVAVDGHRHASSVGLTIEELRQLLKYLGARDAVNLDGGGSTALYVRDSLVNHPSDAEGERKIGDAVLFEIGR